MLRVDGLSAGYGPVEAIHDLSLSVAEAQLVAIVGANGAGKTALMLSLAGFLKHSGSVTLAGEDVTRLSSFQRSRRGLRLVPEGRRIFADMSVRDNLISGGMYEPARRERSDRLKMVFELFPRLADRQHQPGETLSGGEQQMLAIARTLMGEPRVLLLDEPSLGLAPIMVQEVFRVVGDLKKRGLTILLVEENINHCLALSDYAYVLDQGRVVLHGTGADLLKDPGVRQAYLGGGRRSSPA